MMDFFQRRVEALERELTLERERAHSAQGLLAQQDALKSEVDTHLKAITDQLRREKNEREGDVARSHAYGRIETLEKRLDEMNATFAQLLKDAVGSRGEAGPSSEALAAELVAFRAALKDAVEGVARWRGEMRDLAQIAPRVQELSERLPENEKRFEESVGRRIEDFAAGMTRLIEDLRRAQENERVRLDERVEALARERADLARLWEDQSRSARERELKERLARESETARAVDELASRLEGLAKGQQGAAQAETETRALLERALQILTTTPHAKDEFIAALKAEKDEIMAELRDRQESLRRFAEERRNVEKSLGDSLLRVSSELEAERARARASEAHAAELLGKVETSAARAADLERAVADRDERVRAIAAERDELARGLMEESDRCRRAVSERRELEASAASADAEWRTRVQEASSRAAAAEAAAADLRSQLSALAGQSARAAQERDAVVTRFSDWDNERRRLLETLRKKDEMISLLSATFQGALKKES
jgi:DNA repair exonuclease SbcCD ATPase subunit